MQRSLPNGMIDWLEIVDLSGGVTAWICQRRDFPTKNVGRWWKPKDLNEIIEMILRTKPVEAAINEECTKRHTMKKLVYDGARLILRGMAHQIHLPVVRSVGYILAKTIKTIYDGVYFNEEQLMRIRTHFMNDPVIFLPTHRSYMDFLIVSLLCFNSDVSLPAIATGMDFMNSKLLGETLRRCGSFFMRRQFGKDNLYWSLFTGYIQLLLLEAEHPVEFFLEGTRSRSGKSLYPKCGLLQMCIELYLRRQLYDLIVVPISISYDKVLEELLYAYEGFGFPKPKESATGLFKAREILKERFGHIYVSFGEPISVRKYFVDKIHQPRVEWQSSTDCRISEDEKEAVKDFALHVIRIQNANSTVTVWPYTCAVLLKMSGLLTECPTFTFGGLLKLLEDFIALARNLECNVVIRQCVADDLRYHLHLHSELFLGCESDLSDSSVIEFQKFVCEENDISKKNYIEEVLCVAVLSHYVNQMMHDLADVSILSIVLLKENKLCGVRTLFEELRLLFSREFVCSSRKEELDIFFNVSWNRLVRAGAISSVENDFACVGNDGVLKECAYLVQPFIVRYHCVMQSLVELTGTKFTEKMLFEKSLRIAISLRCGKIRNRYSSEAICITTDLVRNILQALCSLEVVIKCDEAEYDVGKHLERLERFRQLLEGVSLYVLPFDEKWIVSKT